MKIFNSLFVFLGLFILMSCSNSEINSPDTSNNKLLKIPIPDDVNGKIVEFKVITNKSKKNAASMSVSSSLEDQYLIDDFNGDGIADVAVRRNNLLIMDYNRDGVSDHSFTFGNGNSERGYYNTDGGIAIVRGNAIYIDDNLDGIADRSFTFGNGNSESEYLLMRPSGIAVRRGNLIIWDLNMDGIPNSSFTFGYGDSEDQYSHAPVVLGSSGWGLRRDYTWFIYPSGTYSYGLGNQEDGYFFGKFKGGSSYYECAILRYNTFYYDNNNDGQSDGSFSFGTGLK